MNEKIPAIIVDVDGTVAEKYSQREIYDFSKVEDDYPIWPTIKVIRSLLDVYTPIFVSGRKEICKLQTQTWLHHWIIRRSSSDWFLFMRADNDDRDDAIVKSEIYDRYIKDKYDVFCVFDDRKKVIDMWRSRGLFVFNCSQLENNDF